MKKCILFSGGFDSIAAALKLGSSWDLVFIDYNQLYLDNEYRSAIQFAAEKGFRITLVRLPNLETDQYRRNFYFLMEAVRLGYREIAIGSRNILPIFDKFKDSNWLSLKLFGYLLGVKIRQPVIGMSKNMIISICAQYSGTPYNCYFNNDSHLKCECPNCRQLRELNYKKSK